MKVKYLIVFVLMMLFVNNVSAEWNQFRGDANKRGESYQITLPFDEPTRINLSPDNKYIASSYNFQPLFYQDIMYIRGGELQAYNTNTGNMIFETISASSNGAPIYINFSADVYYLTNKTTDPFSGYHKYSLATGEILSSIDIQDVYDYPTPTAKNGIIYLINEYPLKCNVRAIYESNMTQKWIYSSNAPNFYCAGGTSPAVDDNYVYFAQRYVVKKLYIDNGTLAAQSPDSVAGTNMNGLTPSLDDNYVYIFTYPNKIYAYNKVDMSEVWNYTTIVNTNSYKNVLAVDDNSVYAIANVGWGSPTYVEKINKVYGTQEWNYTVCDNCDSSLDGNKPTVDNNYVIVTNTSTLFIVDKYTGVEAYNYSFGSGVWITGHYVSEDAKIYVPVYNAGIGNSIYIFETSAPSNPNVLGKVQYREVDGNVYDLENAYVYINSTLNAYTSSNGNYNIANVPAGTYTITASYPKVNSTASAMNPISYQISASLPFTTRNFELLYSKPLLSNVRADGNFFYADYSHNFRTLKLWENPNFVWGVYEPVVNQSINNTIYRQCNYDGSNVFSCPKLTNFNYTFNFRYSDVYNNYLNIWHPTLLGERNFSSSRLFFRGGEEQPVLESEFKLISRMEQRDREKYLKNIGWDILFMFLVGLGMLYVISWGQKR